MQIWKYDDFLKVSFRYEWGGGGYVLFWVILFYLLFCQALKYIQLCVARLQI